MSSPPTMGSSKLLPLKDGHLDLSRIPDSVLALTQQNASESPFLRLPEEIRNRIWEFVMIDLKVNVRLPETTYREPSSDPPQHPSNPQQSLQRHIFKRCHLWFGPSTTGTSSKISASSPLESRITKRAFQLPRVCRQIYAETHILLYVHATFVYIPSYINQVRHKRQAAHVWNGLSRKQIEAMSTLTPSFDCWVRNLDSKSYVISNYSFARKLPNITLPESFSMEGVTEKRAVRREYKAVPVPTAIILELNLRVSIVLDDQSPYDYRESIPYLVEWVLVT